MPAFGKLNYVNVGRGGTFVKTGNWETTPQDVDDLFRTLDHQVPGRLTLHFHGGLIAEDAGYAIARKMFDVYDGAGSHAISFVWETGLLETFSDRIRAIGDTTLFNKLLKLVLKRSAKHLGLQVAPDGSRGPGEMTQAELDAELTKDRPFENLDTPAARGGAAITTEAELEGVRAEIEEEMEGDVESDLHLQALLVSEANRLPPEVAAELTTEGARGVGLLGVAKMLAKVTYRVIRRFVTDRDHGFYPTVVEEILRELYIADLGAWVWSGMKTKAEEMWRPNAGRAGSQMYAGTYFLDGLAAYAQRHPEVHIDVVGHSAGSIAIGHMLDAVDARHPALRFRNLLLLAPACTSALFESKLLRRLGTRFQDFRMFTMSDEFESKDMLVKGIYTRSLLYFISGVLEDEVDQAIAGMHRYLSGKAPYTGGTFDSMRTFLTAQGRIVLSKTGNDAASGLSSHSTSHGFFDDDPVTRTSLQHIIRQ
jgi:hypothetical protein